jgi:hypothetical protein
MAKQSGLLLANSGEVLRSQERRVAVRFPCTRGVVASSLRTDTDVCLAATVLNLSRRGLGLLVSQPVAVGTIVGVELHSHALQVPCFLLARVMNVREQPGPHWVLGCQLASQLPETDLQAFR